MNGKAVGLNEIGSIIEFPSFYEQLSVKENMVINCNLSNSSVEKIRGALDLVNLWDVNEKKVSTLSLGMKQRLGLAKVSLGNYKILLLDEPLNGLDPIWIKKSRTLLKTGLNSQESIIIISSHNLNELQFVVDRFIFMDNGKIICELDKKDTYSMIKTKNKIVENEIFKKITSENYISDKDDEEIESFFSRNKKLKYEKKILSLEEVYEEIINTLDEVKI